MLDQFAQWLTQTVGHWGYPGIVILMFLESSFFPFPSEIVIPPAGYLAAKGVLDIRLVILAGTFGSLLGACFNYWLAMYLGRPFFENYGKYLLIKQNHLDKARLFFEKHGDFSIFISRLLPGIRQYISLPAGIAKMKLLPFCLYTVLGAAIWVVILAFLGFFFGQNTQLLETRLKSILLVLLPLCLLSIILYIYIVRCKKRKEKKKDNGFTG